MSNYSGELINRISVLSQLAKIDDDVDVKELTFIYNVCLRNNIEVSDVAEIITHPNRSISFENSSIKEKIDLMTDLLLLMMVDGKVLPKEIDFCLSYSKKLGFSRNAINNLINDIQSNGVLSEEVIKNKISQMIED